MTTFVLVHGAWGGSWCWADVTKQLSTQGYDVRAPTLTGLADRSHLLRTDIDLSTHITDVTRMIEWEDLSDVVLVGHSYGGMVINGVWAALPERVTGIVYIDAFVPDPGQSSVDILPWLNDVFADLARPSGGYYMDPLDPADLGVEDESALSLIREMSTPMPIACMREPLPGPDRPRDGTPITFINCTRPGNFADTASAGRELGWTVVDLEGDHFPSITQPDVLTSELIQTLNH
ncbi:alpha/beta fold hydrolase [Streptomyces prunicolor]|uniref:alpha/beta fold hydrolase n=1 Tax=Streptomyces prunicolor TaxID=67348 RepID=UPI003422B063